MKPLKKDATYADLCEVPEHFVAEMFDGELYATPRPAPLHTQVSSALGMELAVFHRSGGGWRILDEPELHCGSCSHAMRAEWLFVPCRSTLSSSSLQLFGLSARREPQAQVGFATAEMGR